MPMHKKPVGGSNNQGSALPPIPPQISLPAMADDPLVSDIQRKIDRERAIVEAATRMRQKAAQSMQPTIDNQIHEGRRNIDYLEGRMRELQMRRMGQGIGSLSLGQGNGASSSSSKASGPQQRASGGNRGGQQTRQSGFTKEDADYGDAGPGGYSDLHSPHSMPARAPFGPSGPGGAVPKGRPNYSRLGESTL